MIVRGDVDQRVGDRRELVHGRRRVALAAAMRVWVDLTNSPHPLVLRPVVERLRADGHEVEVTARDFAQTVELARRAGLDADRDRPPPRRGARRRRRAGLASRSAALARWARGRRFELRARPRLQRRHASPRRRCGSRARRCSTTSGRRSSTTSTAGSPASSSFPTRSRPRACAATARRGKVARLPGPQGGVLPRGLRARRARCSTSSASTRASRSSSCARRPSVSLYHRFENELFAGVLERVRGAQAVVLPRVDVPARGARARPAASSCPTHAIDAQSLIAYADLVISAGGTMNREAVALGTPVWTTFEGRLGAVDERLIADGRMRRLERARADRAAQARRARAGERVRRDPACSSRSCWAPPSALQSADAPTASLGGLPAASPLAAPARGGRGTGRARVLPRVLAALRGPGRRHRRALPPAADRSPGRGSSLGTVADPRAPRASTSGAGATSASATSSCSCGRWSSRRCCWSAIVAIVHPVVWMRSAHDARTIPTRDRPARAASSSSTSCSRWCS